MGVDMADSWYEFTDANHFWIQRRFRVLEHMLKGLDVGSLRWLDVGCGTGLLQDFCRTKYSKEIHGADLNLFALGQNASGPENTYCYNILERHKNFEGTYDVVSVLDVVEHIEDEAEFIDALLFHLKKGGILVVNVPALQKLYSQYDVEAGHKRRYSKRDIERISDHHDLSVKKWTYWGFPLLPILFMRNLAVSRAPKENIIKNGFSPPNKLASIFLEYLAKCESIPNHLVGTSVMAFFIK